MAFIDMKDYGSSAKLYWWTVTSLGLIAFAYAITGVLRLEPAAFRQIEKPVLVVHGTQDRNAAYGGGRDWAMTFPNARLVTVEGAAHCAWADDPELVLGAIDAFLGGNWPETSERVTQLERSAKTPSY